MVTWWGSGKAFIANDSGERSVAAWYGNGPVNWGALNLNPKINLLGDVDEFSTWPATPWDAKAVENGYETYCLTNHLNPAFNGDINDSKIPGSGVARCPFAYTPPSVLWRYDAIPDLFTPDNDGNNGKITVIAKVYWPAVSFLYISAGRGNIFPANADYIFCNAWGGIRIPRKVIRHKISQNPVGSDVNSSNANG